MGQGKIAVGCGHTGSRLRAHPALALGWSALGRSPFSRLMELALSFFSFCSLSFPHLKCVRVCAVPCLPWQGRRLGLVFMCACPSARPCPLSLGPWAALARPRWWSCPLMPSGAWLCGRVCALPLMNEFVLPCQTFHIAS